MLCIIVHFAETINLPLQKIIMLTWRDQYMIWSLIGHNRSVYSLTRHCIIMIQAWFNHDLKYLRQLWSGWKRDKIVIHHDNMRWSGSNHDWAIEKCKLILSHSHHDTMMYSLNSVIFQYILMKQPITIVAHHIIRPSSYTTRENKIRISVAVLFF